MPSPTSTEKQAALAAIAEQITSCPTCHKNTTGLPVPGEGNPNADIVFIGEAPGKQEAASGRPFIGASGKVLRAHIQGIGLKDTDVFITSPVKYLPIHVTPTPEEVAHGREHLFKQLNVIQPKIIVLLGRVAVLAVLQKNVSIAKEHGTIVTQEGRTYFITYHPAAGLYAPKTRDLFKEDFSTLQALLKSVAT